MTGQYLIETLGHFIANSQGQEKRTHDLYEYLPFFEATQPLQQASHNTIKQLNTRKGIEYPHQHYYHFQNRPLAESLQIADAAFALSKTASCFDEDEFYNDEASSKELEQIQAQLINLTINVIALIEDITTNNPYLNS